MKQLSCFHAGLNKPAYYFIIFKFPPYADERWEYGDGVNGLRSVASKSIRREFPLFDPGVSPVNVTASIHNNFLTLMTRSVKSNSSEIKIFRYYEGEQPQEIYHLKNQEEIDQWYRQNI